MSSLGGFTYCIFTISFKEFILTLRSNPNTPIEYPQRPHLSWAQLGH